MLVDTHAHLNFKDFEKDLDSTVKEALKKGVSKIVCVSSNFAESKKAIEIAKRYSEVVYAAVGIHPQKTDPENSDSPKIQLDKLDQLAKHSEIVAIGECGLDYSPAPPGELDRSRKEQFFLFEQQIELAKKLNLPLLIHSRKAITDTIGILQKHFNQLNNQSFGIWHCYYAGKKEIAKIQGLGLFFGIAGNLTYDPGLQNVAREIPLDKIVLETDCPFLSPEPFRGLRNHPGNVKIIAEYMAQLLGLSFEKICQITTENAKKVFPKIR